jgi:hypothetical protein
MSTSKEEEKEKAIQFPWPKGNNSNFLILSVPYVTDRMMQNVMSFVCGNCIYEDEGKTKKKPIVDGVTPSPQVVSTPINLEALFTDAVGDGADNQNQQDFHRFQSHPSRQKSLLKCQSLASIVSATQFVINQQISGYTLFRLSVLYSLSSGKHQGMHVDDGRSIDDIRRDGEMLSVIFALQDGTKLDICRSDTDLVSRKTYIIPSGSMFLLSGKCFHGGSTYKLNNVRIHMMFVTNNIAKVWKKENTIPLVYVCPVANCHDNKGRPRTFSRTQLYDHWKLFHKSKLGLSLGKYENHMLGKDIIRCEGCQKGFTSRAGLKRHQRSRCRNNIV